MELDRLVMPGSEIQSKIMKPTAGFKHSVLKTWFPIPDFVFDNPVTFDTADNVFNAHPNRSEPVVDVFVRSDSGLPLGFFLGCRMATLSRRKP